MPTSSKTLKLNPFLQAMEELSLDAIDKEVCKKFRELLATGSIPVHLSMIHAMLRTPENVSIESVTDELRPFFRHYQFMVSRDKKAFFRKRETILNSGPQWAAQTSDSLLTVPSKWCITERFVFTSGSSSWRGSV